MSIRKCDNQDKCQQPILSLRPTKLLYKHETLCQYCLTAPSTVAPPIVNKPTTDKTSLNINILTQAIAKPIAFAPAPSSFGGGGDLASPTPGRIVVPFTKDVPSPDSPRQGLSPPEALPATLKVIPFNKPTSLGASKSSVSRSAKVEPVSSMESIQAGSLNVRIPARRGVLNYLSRAMSATAGGRALFAAIEALMVYSVMAGRFWYSLVLAALSGSSALLGVLLRGGRRIPRAFGVLKIIFIHLRWGGLLSLDGERLLVIVSNILMSAAFWTMPSHGKMIMFLRMSQAGLILGLGLIVNRAVQAAGRRSIEDRKPHWFVDWTRSTGLTSKDVYDLNLGFEKTTADMFTELGFQTTHVGVENARDILGHASSGDSGLDVMADDKSGKRLIISCKRYGGKVGPDEVKILHMDMITMAKQPFHSNKRLVGVIVTTVGFTSGALSLAQSLNIATLTLEDLRNQAEKQFLY